MIQVAIGFSSLFFSLGLDQAFVREYHEVFDKKKLFKATLLPCLFFITSILFLFNLIKPGLLSSILFGIDNIAYSVMVSSIMIISLISRFVSLIIRMEERGFAYSMSQVIQKILVLSILVIYYFGKFKLNFHHLLIVTLASSVTALIIFIFNSKKIVAGAIFSHIEFKFLIRLLKFGFPLVWGGLAFWGLTTVDRVFLKSLSTLNQLALYSVAFSFAAAATIVQSVFSTVWAPMVYKWSIDVLDVKVVYKVSRYMMLCIIILFSLMGIFSWLTRYILPPEYNEVRWLIISCLGYPLLYTLSETTVIGINLSKRTVFSMLAAFLAFAVNIVGNWMLIPTFGASGAAVSTSFSFYILFLLRTEFSIFLWKRIPRLLIYTYSSLLVVGATASTLWGESFQSLVTVFWFSMLMSIFFFFHKEIVEICLWFKRR